MTATLWATAADKRRLARARSAVLLVGSYDGSGNYGDVLQFAAALRTARELAGSPLPVAIVERETLGHHRRLVERYPAELSGPVYVHFADGKNELPGDDLVEVAGGLAPSRSVLYLYGGGYLNRWWGARKVAHARMAVRLAGRRRLPTVASGLQVDEETVAPGGAGHELLSKASWIGLRGIRSLEYVRSHIDEDDSRVSLTGDDALPALSFGPATPAPVVNLHINDGHWVSDEPGAMAARVVALLRQVGRASGAPLELQPVIAYEDHRVKESRVVAQLLARHGGDLESSGLRPKPPLDILSDATGNELGAFRGARLTVSCSYHVALTSLLAGIPTVMLAENAYYDQKAAALRHLFGLDERLVGVRGTAEDAAFAARVLGDGPPRRELVDGLLEASAAVVERHERGRDRVKSELTAGLRASAGQLAARGAIRRSVAGRGDPG
jgi:polysaccharide pyruvyl transferase